LPHQHKRHEEEGCAQKKSENVSSATARGERKEKGKRGKFENPTEGIILFLEGGCEKGLGGNGGGKGRKNWNPVSRQGGSGLFSQRQGSEREDVYFQTGKREKKPPPKPKKETAREKESSGKKSKRSEGHCDASSEKKAHETLFRREGGQADQKTRKKIHPCGKRNKKKAQAKGKGLALPP